MPGTLIAYVHAPDRTLSTWPKYSWLVSFTVKVIATDPLRASQAPLFHCGARDPSV